MKGRPKELLGEQGSSQPVVWHAALWVLCSSPAVCVCAGYAGGLGWPKELIHQTEGAKSVKSHIPPPNGWNLKPGQAVGCSAPTAGHAVQWCGAELPPLQELEVGNSATSCSAPNCQSASLPPACHGACRISLFDFPPLSGFAFCAAAAVPCICPSYSCNSMFAFTTQRGRVLKSKSILCTSSCSACCCTNSVLERAPKARYNPSAK